LNFIEILTSLSVKYYTTWSKFTRLLLDKQKFDLSLHTVLIMGSPGSGKSFEFSVHLPNCEQSTHIFKIIE